MGSTTAKTASPRQGEGQLLEWRCMVAVCVHQRCLLGWQWAQALLCSAPGEPVRQCALARRPCLGLPPCVWCVQPQQGLCDGIYSLGHLQMRSRRAAGNRQLIGKDTYPLTVEARKSLLESGPPGRGHLASSCPLPMATHHQSVPWPNLVVAPVFGPFPILKCKGRSPPVELPDLPSFSIFILPFFSSSP